MKETIPHQEKLPASSEKVLDSQWYSRFEKIGSFQAYEYLDGDSKKRHLAKESFLKGECLTPDLDYPLLEGSLLASRESALLKLKRDILTGENNSVVREVYRWKINEKIAECRMLQATRSGDARKFHRYSQFIYGKPEEAIFSYSLRSVFEAIQSGQESADASMKDLSAELSSLLATKNPSNSSVGFSLPSQETTQIVHGDTLHTFGQILHLLDQESFSAEEIKTAFEEALSILQAEGWVVRIHESKSGISVNQEEKSVLIPESKSLSFKKLRGLIVHEIGTHVARRQSGERSRLKLLGLGLDRYEVGEEGVTGIREQVLGGSVKDFSGFDGYIAIGLACGLDGKKRDFRETYTFLQKYYQLKHLLNGKSRAESYVKSCDSAWSRSVRTFRGTDGKTPGLCFTKDLVYRKGNIAVWDTVNKNLPEMHRWNIGKYDPSNPRHIWILDQLNITDTELVNLEQAD